MTLDKARELLAKQALVAGGYTRNGAGRDPIFRAKHPKISVLI